MTDYIEEFIELTDEINTHIDRQKQINGNLGIYDNTSQEWVFPVPGEPGFVWVRPKYGGDPFPAFNKAAPLKPDLEVVVEPDINTGRLCITDINLQSAIAYNPQNPPVPVPPTPNGVGSGREQYNSASLIADGLVFSVSGLIIGINSFTASYNQTQQTYTPANTDLTSYLPGSGLQCWALIGINPTDGSVVVNTTTPISIASTLLVSTLSTIVLGNTIPLAAIKLRNGVTALSFPTDFVDQRAWVTGQWFSYPLGVQFGGSAADLSGTGGAHKLVFQETLGGAFTVRVLASSDVPSGAGSPLSAKGDLYTFSTVNTRQPAGADYSIPIWDSSQTTGLIASSSATTAMIVPSGTTLQQPGSPANGMIRYNSTTGRFEFYAGAWKNFVRLDGDTMTGQLINNTGYTGPIGNATPNTGAFTNITITGGGYIRPSTDSTSALLVTKSDGTTAIITVDSTNKTLGIGGTTPITTAWMRIAAGNPVSISLLNPGVIQCTSSGGSSRNMFSWDVNDNVAFGSSNGPINNMFFYVGPNNSAGQILGLTKSAGTLVGNDSGTNAVLNALVVGHNSSGTPTTGFGTAILWTGKDSTTNDVNMSRLRTYWNVATHASRAAYAVLSAYDTAERDVIGIGASGSAGLLGFYGVATSPVAQPASTREIDLVQSDLGLRAAGTPSLSLLGKYNSDTLAGNGLTSVVGHVRLTGQTGGIGATNIFTPPANGSYLVTVYLEDTSAGLVGGTIQANIIYTDDNGSQTQSTAALPLNVTGFTSSEFVLYAKTSAAIQYSTTFVAGTGSPQYALTIEVIRLS